MRCTIYEAIKVLDAHAKGCTTYMGSSLLASRAAQMCPLGPEVGASVPPSVQLGQKLSSRMIPPNANPALATNTSPLSPTRSIYIHEKHSNQPYMFCPVLVWLPSVHGQYRCHFHLKIHAYHTSCY